MLEFWRCGERNNDSTNIFYESDLEQMSRGLVIYNFQLYMEVEVSYTDTDS